MHRTLTSHFLKVTFLSPAGLSPLSLPQISYSWTDIFSSVLDFVFIFLLPKLQICCFCQGPSSFSEKFLTPLTLQTQMDRRHTVCSLF